MGSKKRVAIKDETVRFLWGHAAGRCELCGRALDKYEIYPMPGNCAQVAHNAAYGDGGSRANPALSVIERNSIDNLLLLCQRCHKTIDDNPEAFTYEFLKTRKEQVEGAIARFAKGQALCQTVACTFTAPISGWTPSITDKERNEALLLSNLYDSARKPFDLSEGIVEGVPMGVGSGMLKRRFAKFEEVYSEPHESVSLFAIGPQPLLIELGSLLGCLRDVHVFQRRHAGGWAWPENGREESFGCSHHEGNEDIRDVAVKFMLSGVINDATLPVLPEGTPVYHVETASPGIGLVECEETQGRFHDTVTTLLDGIHEAYPMVRRVHIFPAMPASLAVWLGMSLRFNLINEYVIYEKIDGVFSKSLSIGRPNAA